MFHDSILCYHNKKKKKNFITITTCLFPLLMKPSNLFSIIYTFPFAWNVYFNPTWKPKWKKKKIFDKVEKFEYFQSSWNTTRRMVVHFSPAAVFRGNEIGVSRNCSFQKRRSVIRGADNGSWAGGRTLRSQQRSNVSLLQLYWSSIESCSIFPTIYRSRKKMIEEGVAESIPLKEDRWKMQGAKGGS